jgi:hypothetical protein
VSKKGQEGKGERKEDRKTEEAIKEKGKEEEISKINSVNEIQSVQINAKPTTIAQQPRANYRKMV